MQYRASKVTALVWTSLFFLLGVGGLWGLATLQEGPSAPALRRGHELIQVEQWASALATLREGLARTPDPRLKARYLTAIGHCHLVKGYLREAQAVFQEAVVRDPRHPDARGGLRQVEQLLAERAAERRHPAYQLGRALGSAATLRGSVVLVHCFIRPKATTSWTPAATRHVADALAVGQGWIEGWRQRWGVERLAFREEVLIVDHLVPVRHLLLTTFDEQAEQAWVALLAQALGAPDWPTFVKTVQARHGVRNVAVLLHVDYPGRSWATRRLCRPGKSCPPVPDAVEYALCFRPADRPAARIAVAPYVHELFHLFGADDLYTVVGADDYYPDDLMHEWRLEPEEAVVSPLTAYAVGWLASPPPLQGFAIEEGRVQPEEVRRDA